MCQKNDSGAVTLDLSLTAPAPRRSLRFDMPPVRYSARLTPCGLLKWSSRCSIIRPG